MSARDTDRRPLLGALALLAPLALSILAAEAQGVVPPPAARAAARTLPALDHEPLVGVLIARAPRVSLRLTEGARLEAEGGATRLAPGLLSLEVTAGGWRIAGGQRVVQGPATLRSGGRPIFELEATPLFGEPRLLRLAGDLELSVVDGALEAVERVALEDYLVGVVGAEMNPTWPTAALAAQAIVARSYAAARWMERAREGWQLHWHFGVDMAYHGWSPHHESVERAVASTRGEVLITRGLPVLALFHASSGGRTEAFERVKPGVLGPDGRTPIAQAMPVVDDPASLPGAEGLSLSATHGRWKCDLPLSEVTAALQRWTRAAADRPVFGAVEGVSVLERHADSGRVARVSVRHRLDGRTRFTALGAADFRMAVSPLRIRSLWWERCVVASQPPGYLVLEGRGFGHGCGLSQVSAWYLAQRGETPEAIVARFYAGARIEKRY